MGFSLDRAQQVLMERQLLHANKLMVLGTLGGGLAHEMNNPLASILLEAEYLKKSFARTDRPLNLETADKAASSVIAGVERMRRVLNHLLQYSRVDDPTEGSILSVRKLMEDTFLFMDRQLMSRGIEVRLEVDDTLMLHGNRTQLESVLHNLVSNSRDAFADNGRDGKYIAISARRVANAGAVEITCEDNAGGIPAANLERIFEPFFTTKESAMGTGLGLSLSLKIIQDHGGSIACESAEGRTRFTILLPEASGGSQGDAPAHHPRRG
jgi:signal transduction histidine kinase